MNINGFQVDNFGVWSDLTIGDLPEDLTVFYGPNEAGKSTLMNFVRAILFGFSPEKCQRFLTGPLGQQRRRMGGRLRINGYDGQFYVRRFADEVEPLATAGDVRVTTVDGERVGGHKLASLLTGIDEAIYNNVFCLGMGEIQHLSSLNDTQASQFLYSLTTGTDRVSLVDVMRQLRNARQQLVGNGKPGLLTELIRRRDDQRRQVEQLGSLTDHWGQLRSELLSLDQEIKRLEANRDKLKRQSRMTEIAAGLRPKWVRHKALDAEIVALGPAPELPTGIFDRLRLIDERIVQRRREVDTLKQRRELLVHSEKELQIVDGLQRNAARVKALIDQRSWISTLDEEVRRLESRSEETEFEIQAELEKLGIRQPDDGDDVLPTIDADTLAALHGPARLVKVAKRNLDAAKNESSEHKVEAERIAAEMTRQLGGKAEWLDAGDRGDVNRLMEKTGALAQNARRRVELGRAVLAMTSRLDEIDASRGRLLQLQFQPRPVIVALASVFALGSISLLSALFGTGTLIDESRRGLMVLIGAIACGVAIGVKLLLDGTHRQVLSSTDAERRDLAERIADTDEEIARIDAALPAGTSFAQMLEAGDGLAELDQLMPLDTQRRHALDRAAIAEKRAIEIATSMKDSRLQWEKALAAVGLPTRLTPTQVEQLAGRTGNLTFLRRQFQDLQDQLERARREVGTVQNRVLNLMSEANLQPVSNRPLDQLDQLATTLREQEARVGRRGEYRRQIRELHRQQERLVNNSRRLEHKRATLLTSAKATDDDDLRRLEERRLRILNLNQQRQSLVEEIAASLRAAEDEAFVRGELERASEDDLKKRLTRFQHDSVQVDSQIKERLLHRGELTQQLKSLTEDRQLPLAHIKLAIIERQLKDGLARWKELSATTHLLRRVYKRYEKDRQPETLQQASEYLHRMTEGRYTRIWTPLAEDVLLVDDSNGNSLPIDVLSRGTREQLFLALRLALVSGYARRGVKIPMVLDDVLVNFDIERTVAAAEVLTEFARAGHQIFVFTCHEHIVRVFQDFDAELRDLPSHQHELLNTGVTIEPADVAAPKVTPRVDTHQHDIALRKIPLSVAAQANAPELVSVGSSDSSVASRSFLGDSMLPKNITVPSASRPESVEVASRVVSNETRGLGTTQPSGTTLPADSLPAESLAQIASHPAATSTGISVPSTTTTASTLPARRTSAEIARSLPSFAGADIAQGRGPTDRERERALETSDSDMYGDNLAATLENSTVADLSELTSDLPATDITIPAAGNRELNPITVGVAEVAPAMATQSLLSAPLASGVDQAYSDQDSQEAGDEIDIELADAVNVEQELDEDDDEESDYEIVEQGLVSGNEDADVDEYEYVDEDGNLITAEDLADDEEYEWVEEDEED